MRKTNIDRARNISYKLAALANDDGRVKIGDALEIVLDQLGIRFIPDGSVILNEMHDIAAHHKAQRLSTVLVKTRDE